jgi:methyl-accepting chemotaxis protein
VVAKAVEAMACIEETSGTIPDISRPRDRAADQSAGPQRRGAARAGDAGRGFAVVASEVRVLALHPAPAAN